MNWYKPWRTVGVALTLTLTTTVGIVAMSAIAPAQQPPADQQAATPEAERALNRGIELIQAGQLDAAWLSLSKQ